MGLHLVYWVLTGPYSGVSQLLQPPPRYHFLFLLVSGKLMEVAGKVHQDGHFRAIWRFRASQGGDNKEGILDHRSPASDTESWPGAANSRIGSYLWWHIPAIPELERLRQKDCKSQVSLLQEDLSKVNK